MKKAAISLLLIFVIIFSTACSSGDIDDVAKVADNIYSAADVDREELVEVNEAIIENYYPSILGLTNEFKVYINGPGGKVDEIAVIRATDAAKTAEIATILQQRIKRLEKLFENYVPEEMPKLSSASIVTKGDVVILLISNDNDGKKVIDTAIKG